MFSISAVVQPVKDALTELWNGWRGPIILGVGLLLLGAIVWHFSAPVAAVAEASATIRKIAITVVVLFAVFGLGLVVTFFWLFRGVDADAAQLDKIITYCYAFIVFSLSASVLPFVALPLLPALSQIMARSPIGIVPGCSLGLDESLDGDKQKAPPRELRCGVSSEQWVVNIGGMVAPLQKATNTSVPGAVAPAPSASVEKWAALPGTVMLTQISGGLVVPLYAVVLSLMGAAVSMTRRVPEFQRRLTFGDPEHVSYDSAREGLVFQIMQVASAPLIVLTAYYLVDPNSRASTIALSFASGFSSETVLLMIRALVEKLKPAQSVPAVHPAPPGRSPSPSVTMPGSLNFGTVRAASPSRKPLTVSNTGTAPLVINKADCTGQFISMTAMPLTIAPGADGVIEVEFTPVSAGTKQEFLTITDNASDSPRAVILSGTGS